MIFILLIFLLAQLILLTGFVRLTHKRPQDSSDAEISVITAAKNEKGKVDRFINAVSNIDYSARKYEIIFVDDNSDDGTLETAVQAARNIDNIKVISAGEKILPGKRGALLKGIEESKYPIIMVTDADCLPSPDWLRSASAQFSQGYDFIVGPAPLIRKRSNFISSLSCMENLKSHFLSSGLASLGLPYTAAARNMGFSKKAFFRIGGYQNTLNTVGGDDDLLLREAVKHKLKIKVFHDENAMVYSDTEDNLSDYLKQKARHTQTSLYYSLKNKFILAGWHILNLFMLFSPLLMFVDLNFAWLAAVKLSTDVLILSFIQKKYHYNFTVISIFFLDIVYEIFLIINFFNSVFGNIRWKQPDAG